MSDADPGDGSGSAQGPGDECAPEPAPSQQPSGDAPGGTGFQPVGSQDHGLEGRATESDPAQAAGDKTPGPEAPQAAQPEKKKRPSVVVRYGLMMQIGEFRHNLKELPAVGTVVVVRTERGVERGAVVVNVCDREAFGCIRHQALDGFLKACGKDYPFRREGKVLRPANHQDIVDYRHLTTSGREEAAFCREQIRELELPMRVVTVEHLLGGGRIIFYFAAESRVDFRELVRRLANQYHTRIEMRQVGARDEARLVADYERCGQRCCCQRFLQYLKPVSMRMAKTQKATLDPSKISGRCGRLMCCLRFEDTSYEALRKNLPRRNTWVRTEELVGRVADAQILTQLVRLALPDNSTRVVSVEDIIERDVPAPSPTEEKAPRRRGKRTADRSARPDDEPAKKGESPEPPGKDEDQGDESQRKKRKRRRRKKGQPAADAEAPARTDDPAEIPSDESSDPPRDGPGDQPPDSLEQQPPPDGGAPGDRPSAGSTRPAPKRRRRRRKRGKKSSG